LPQNAVKDSFCSKKEEGVNEGYILDEFISKKKAPGNRKVLINTIIYFDTNNQPYAFLMYKNYPHDKNSIYISILCIDSLHPKTEFSSVINGDQIVSNFKIACESVGVHNIYLESIPSAEKFWKSKGFKLVEPQPVSSKSSKSSRSKSSSSNKSRKSNRSYSSKSRKSSSYSSSSSSGVKDKLYYFNLIPTESRAKGTKTKIKRNKSKRKGKK